MDIKFLFRVRSACRDESISKDQCTALLAGTRENLNNDLERLRRLTQEEGMGQWLEERGLIGR